MAVTETSVDQRQDLTYVLPSNGPDEIDFLDLMLLLARRKKQLLLMSAAFALGAVIVSLLIPNRYTATTRILPPQQSQSLAGTLMGQLGSLGALGAVAGKDLGLKNPNDIYVGMLTSRTVEDSLVKRFDLVRVYKAKRLSDARQRLESRSHILLGKDGFISVSVEDTDKTRSADMANAYVDELKKLMGRLAVTEAGQRRLFFEQQLEQAKDRLADAEQALARTQQQTGLIDLSGQARAIIGTVVNLRAQIAAKEVELQSMKIYATDDNPNVLLAQQQLAGWRAQLAKLEVAQGQSGKGDIGIATSEVPQAGLEYIRRLRDVKYYETIFELLAKQYEAAKLDEAKNSAVVQVVDSAVEPDRKSFPPRTVIVVLAAFLGVMFACGIVLLGEAMKRLQRDPGRARKMAALTSQLMRL